MEHTVLIDVVPCSQNFSSAKKIWEVLTVLVGLFLQPVYRYAQIGILDLLAEPREKIKRSTYRFMVVILHLWAREFREKKGMRCCKNAPSFIIYTPTPLTVSE